MSDLDRLRKEYADRAYRLVGSDKYTLFNEPNLFAFQQRQRDLTRIFVQEEITPLYGKRILEVGCGGGGVLLELLQFGAAAGSVNGVELLPARLLEGKQRLAHSSLLCANGQKLPYATGSFDLVLQFTVFSSILDRNIQREIAQEMVRVLHSDGVILWYDFWLNPTNPHTVGMRPQDIRRLFPTGSIQLERVTLAPPMARRLVPMSWVLAALLEKLKLFNTHYLAVIRPNETCKGV